MRGIISIVIGIGMIAGGLTGKWVLVGTQSGAALAGVGVLVVLVGFARLKRS
jgi:hypothetical protein